MNIRIEEPCHENWNAMTQQEKGRHCDKCCKTVFDFTNMPTEEVIRFIASKEKGSVCGRFTSQQVNVPVAVKAQLNVSWNFKKFLAALMLVFGGALFTGCGDETQGKLMVVDSTRDMGIVVTLPDTITAKDTIVPKTDSVKKVTGKNVCPGNPVADEQKFYNGGPVPEPTVVGITVLYPSETPVDDNKHDTLDPH